MTTGGTRIGGRSSVRVKLMLALLFVASMVVLLGACTSPSANDQSTQSPSGGTSGPDAGEQAVLQVTVTSSREVTESGGAVGTEETFEASLYTLAPDDDVAIPVDGYASDRLAWFLPPAVSSDGRSVAYSPALTGREDGVVRGAGLRRFQLRDGRSVELTSSEVVDFGWGDAGLVAIVDAGVPDTADGEGADSYPSSPRVARWSEDGSVTTLADTDALRSAGMTYTPTYLGSDGSVLYLLDRASDGLGRWAAGGGTIWRLGADGLATRVAELATTTTDGVADRIVWQDMLARSSRTALADGLLPIVTSVASATEASDTPFADVGNAQRTVEVFRARNLSLVRAIDIAPSPDGVFPGAPVFDGAIDRYLSIGAHPGSGPDDPSVTCWITETDVTTEERTALVPVPCPGDELPWVDVVGYTGGDVLYVTQEGGDQAGLVRAVVTRFDRSEGVTETVLELESAPGEAWSSVDVRILGP
jgi:hypothetical protein